MRLLLTLALLSACGNEKAETPADAPAAEATAPGGMTAAELAAHASLTGTVTETVDSGGYTYLKLRTASGESWAAIQQTTIAVGDTVTLANVQVMHDFESRTLNRTFDEILFATLDNGGAASGDMSSMHSGMKTTEAVEPVEVARAEGPDGRLVSELFAQKSELSGKPVAVRGQVVKFLPDIMGKNWVHLRDGSGSDASGDNDLTVTTSATVAVGDVVLATGTLGTDRDLGAGYSYAVIIEDATLEK